MEIKMVKNSFIQVRSIHERVNEEFVCAFLLQLAENMHK